MTNPFSLTAINPLRLIRRFVRAEAPVEAPAISGSATAYPTTEAARTVTQDPATTFSPRPHRRRSRRPRGPAGNGQRVITTGEEPVAPAPVPGSFGPLPMSGPVASALREMGYVEPTPVQLEVIPLMQAGRDLVGQAQTGTGKTAAFGIPLMQLLDPKLKVVQAIVLVPTRELALQVTGELRKLAKYTDLKIVTLYGGQPIIKQFTQLEPPPQIIVGTPGRVLDHLGRSTLRLDGVRIAVLDEADEMLDIGFAPDMERILRLTPRSRQTTLFSATIPTPIMRLINRYLRDPAWVHIQPEALTVPEIDQVYYEVAERDKLDALSALLAEWGSLPRALIFCRMQVGVDRLTVALNRRGYQVQGIHGGMTQSERTRVMRGFREGSIQGLIATNVAARGLDIPDITHVVSYDAPQNTEEYIHRIGRTGRMGRSGLAITFISENDFDLLDQLIPLMGAALRQEQSSIYARHAV